MAGATQQARLTSERSMAARASRTIWLPLAVTWLAFLLRVGGLLSQSLWRDEVDTLRFSTQALPALLEMFRKPGENGPLFFLTLRPWLAIGGSSEFALRFPSALAGTLAVPLLYALIRRLTRERSTATIAALLLATAPYAVWYGQEAKMYAALTVLVPLSFYLALQASWKGRWWRWALLYIVTSLSFYVHLLAALALPVQAVWLLILPPLAPGIEPGSARRRRLSALLYLALLILPYLPLVQWQLPAWLAADQQTGFPFVPLPTILLILLTAFSRGILPVTQRIALLPMVLALLTGIGLWAALPAQGAPRPRWWRWGVVGLLLAWLLWPALGIYLISLRRPLFADRYLIWALPAFLALAAMGVAALRRVWRPLGGLVLGAILTLNLTASWSQAAQPIKSDFRAAAEFVDARRQPGDLLVFQIPYNRHTFAYYSGVVERWLDGPYTNNGMSEADLDAEMTRGTDDARAVWLIASEVPMWDERNLTEAWLNRRGAVTEHAEFARVAVTRYTLR
jgi:mannosyltransferase